MLFRSGEVVAAASPWNKDGGARSPPRRRSFGRSRRAPGVGSSRIFRSGEAWCPKGGCRGGGDGFLWAFWSLVPIFVSVLWLLASPWGCWGLGGGAPAVRVGGFRCLYRSWLGFRWSSVAPSVVMVDFAGAKMDGDGGPGRCRWFVGMGSAGFLCGRPDPEQVELGARRRPIRLHWLHPSRWRWCLLRLSTLSGKGFFLLQDVAVKTMMLPSSAACCGVYLWRLQVWWMMEVSCSSVLLLYLLLCLLCTCTFRSEERRVGKECLL